MCEHEVIMGVSKKSLHTWQRNACSIGARYDKGVSSQSEESATLNELSIIRSLVLCITGAA